MYKQKCSLDEAMRLAQVRRPRISPFGHLLTLLSLWEKAFLCRPSSSDDDSTSSGDETDARRTEYRGSGGLVQDSSTIRKSRMASPGTDCATPSLTPTPSGENVPLQNLRIVSMRSCPGKSGKRNREYSSGPDIAFNSADGGTGTGNFRLGLEHPAPAMHRSWGAEHRSWGAE